MNIDSVIEKIRNGNGQEVEKVYKEYRGEFLSWIVKRYAISDEEAKEIYQNTMVIFYENIIQHKIDTMRSNIKTYLFAIGKNKALEWLRKKNKHVQVEESIIENSFDGLNFESDEPDGHGQMLDKVGQALEKLGEPCASILKYYYYHNYGLGLITEKMNYKNVDTTKNIKYKCLQRLKKIFRSELETNNNSK